MMNTFLLEARRILGVDAVLHGSQVPPEYIRGTTGSERSVPAVLFPSTVEHIVSLVRLAAHHRCPLYPISTGKNWGYGDALPSANGSVVVNLSRLNRIIEPPDPASGLVTVEPGVTLGDLAAYVERERLPFIVPTIGAGPGASLVGNALERGHGITPIIDHFSAVVSIEAVLPDGSIYRSPQYAMSASPAGRDKWGVGPYVDGLFSQGSFGVVTKMTLALAPKPEAIKAFVFGVPSESDLEATVAAVQLILRSLGGVVGGINIMNARRMLAMQIPYPRHRTGASRVISNNLLDELSREHGIMPWTVFGTLFGQKRVVGAAEREIRRMLPGTARRFVCLSPSGAARISQFVHALPLVRSRWGRTAATLAAALALVGGQPNETALPLAYWRGGKRNENSPLDPGRDGCGISWYAPLVEMRPDRVRRFVEIVKPFMLARGLEPLITFQSLSERSFIATVPLLFDRQYSEEIVAARACLEGLLDIGFEQGFTPYRVGIDSMAWLADKLGNNWRIVSLLKGALDPLGIIAPGRYAPLVEAGRESTVTRFPT